jgi:hypothetical protein
MMNIQMSFAKPLFSGFITPDAMATNGSSSCCIGATDGSPNCCIGSSSGSSNCCV